MTLEAPHVASRSPESGLDLLGAKPIALIRLKRCCRDGCPVGPLINAQRVDLNNFHCYRFTLF